MRSPESGAKPGIVVAIPWVAISIIAVNVLAFVFTRPTPEMDGFSLLDVYGLRPSQMSAGRLLTSAFVHDSIIHLSVNMALLYAFGCEVERAMGRLEFLIFYIAACFVSSIAHVGMTLMATMPAYYEDVPIVGASGAVSAVIGVYAVRFHRRIFRFGGAEIPVLAVIMAWLVLQLVMGVLGLYQRGILGLELKMVSYWSHLGGFAFGIVIALLTDMALSGEREHLIRHARRHDAEQNLLEAIRNYELLLRHDPDSPLAHAELGRLWALLEEQDQSIPCYQAAVELYIAKGREEQALEAAGEMMRFWPTASLSPATRFRLASYLEESGHPTEAIDALREIAASESDSAQTQMSIVKMGHIRLVSLGDNAGAAKTLRDFLNRYPDSDWRAFAEDTLARAEEQQAQS